MSICLLISMLCCSPQEIKYSLKWETININVTFDKQSLLPKKIIAAEKFLKWV